MHLLLNLRNAVDQNWQSFEWTVAMLIFLVYLLLDIMYARYTFALVNLKAITAANTGSLMYILAAYGVLNYTHNFLYVVPLGLGSWLGTYIVVTREKAKKDKQS